MVERKSLEELFKGRQFEQEIILLCVRWYLQYKLSFRDLVEMMEERGLAMSHTTIMRWVQRYVPEFEKRWKRYARKAEQSWRVDETYVKICGRWAYLYRAVDRAGKIMDLGSAPSEMSLQLRPFLRRRSRAKARHRRPYAGRLRGIASCGARDEGGGPTAPGYEASILEILEPPDRARPPKHQVEGTRHAWLQTV
jgi:hypothetical protein